MLLWSGPAVKGQISGDIAAVSRVRNSALGVALYFTQLQTCAIGAITKVDVAGIGTEL